MPGDRREDGGARGRGPDVPGRNEGRRRRQDDAAGRVLVPQKGRKLLLGEALLLGEVARDATKNDKKLGRREQFVAEAEDALHAGGQRDETVAAIQEAEAKERPQDGSVRSV